MLKIRQAKIRRSLKAAAGRQSAPKGIMASLSRCCAFARVARSTGSVASMTMRHKTSGRTSNTRPKRVKLRVKGASQLAGRPAVEVSSKQTQRPFKVKDPRYGIAGEGRAEEEASIAGNDAFRAFLFLGAFPLVGLATLVLFNDDLRAQYLERWAQDTGKNQLSQQAQR